MARQPLYQIVEADMIARITKGEWEVGLRLPNEFGLADEFKVSQGTMRRALISLEAKGYLSRKPGRGTIVAARTATRPGGAVSAPLAPAIIDASGVPLTLAPFRGRVGARPATSREADHLGAARLVVLERTLKHRGARAALEELVISEGALTAAGAALSEDAPAELRDHMTALGLSPARVEAEATVEMTDMSQSVALSTDRHTALLCVRSTAFDAADTPLAVQVLKLAVPGARLVHISG